MTKSELKTGMVVTRRDGKKLTVYRNCACSFTHPIYNDVFVNAETMTWHSMDDYNEDLTTSEGSSKFDIVLVELVHHPYDFNQHTNNAMKEKTIWERNPPKKMTVAEIEAELGYRVEIISE